MRTSVCRLVGVVLGLSFTLALASEPVLVQGEENGQGVLRVRNGECFAIVPEHVVGYGLNLFVAAADRTRASAEVENTFGDDIAIIRVHAQGRLDCGTGWTASPGLDARLRSAVAEGKTASIIRVRATGGLESYPVRVHGYDDRYIEVAPLGSDITIFQGVSGSRLLLGGLPAGMVMSVDSELGLIRVYRQDALTHLVARFFDTSGPRQMPAIDQPVEPLIAKAMATARTPIREEPSLWSPVVRWLLVGQSVAITGKVKGLPWLRTEEGYVRVNDMSMR
ncbi:SH3 domain-containing protein [Pistricoccus aurantiacus]|uniref:SH3 domain-containing protein n=1 Tax=Pistricoccus aurantiacus TaxID=1883414 RepID=UPI003627AB8A